MTEQNFSESERGAIQRELHLRTRLQHYEEKAAICNERADVYDDGLEIMRERGVVLPSTTTSGTPPIELNVSRVFAGWYTYRADRIRRKLEKLEN